MASKFISCFPLSVPSKRTLMLPVGSHSHITSPCLSLLQVLLSKEEQGCPEYLQSWNAHRENTLLLITAPWQPSHAPVSDMHYESGVTCPTPCSPFNHPPLHRHTRPNNFISVISQSPHRAAFLPGICKGNLTKGKPSRDPAFQQELQQNWKLIM